MSRAPEPLETRRLWLRAWRDADLEPFARLNADPEVAEFLPGTLSREQSDEFAARICAHFDERGYGLFAVEEKGGSPFIGFVGLSLATFDAPFAPAVEIGWRLARESWGAGLASEAASRALAFGFESLGLDEIVSFTVDANIRSRRLMERIGLVHDPAGSFEHPKLAPGHPLRHHVLYRKARPTCT